MNYRIFGRLGVFFALIMILNWPFNSEAATILNFEPSSKDVTVGENFSLDVFISNVTDLFSYQFDVTFDPTILAAQGITEGPLLSSVGNTFFIPGNIDNGTGTITFIANTLLGPDSGVNGNGVLATITFQALASGISSVGLSNMVLLDSTLTETSASATAGSINVAAVPLPGGLLLFLSGLPMVFVRRIFCRRSK